MSTATIEPPTISTAQAAGLVKEIAVRLIDTSRTQSRAALNEVTVNEYVEAMQGGTEFPSPIVYFDGVRYWLADGFHRLAAVKKLGANYLTCEVREGTSRDALRYSLSANAAHGLQRTNADKRHAVSLALGDEEWQQLSDRMIAEMCGVSHPFVAKLRAELEQDEVVTVTTSNLDSDQVSTLTPEPTKRVGQDGKLYPATQRPPSQDSEDPNAVYSPDAAEAKRCGTTLGHAKSISSTKSPPSGTSVVPGKDRELVRTKLGEVIRGLESLGLYKEFKGCLSQILVRLKELK